MNTVPKVDFFPFEIYLDLDGVFADFDGGFHKITGKYPHEVHKGKLWGTINARGDFFYKLELMEDAEHLWEYFKQYGDDKVKFLTGLPMLKNGKEQKQMWTLEKFGPQWETIVLPKKEKQLHAGPNKVLIDDTEANVEQWVAKGGIGILHTNVWKTIKEVEELRLGYAVTHPPVVE
jgi:hypothetical protein